jgi:hypothetical protein
MIHGRHCWTFSYRSWVEDTRWGAVLPPHHPGLSPSPVMNIFLLLVGRFLFWRVGGGGGAASEASDGSLWKKVSFSMLMRFV